MPDTVRSGMFVADCLNKLGGIVDFDAFAACELRTALVDSSFKLLPLGDVGEQLPARVFVATASGTFDLLVTVPWGEPDRPPDRADLVAKFQTLARGRIPEHLGSNIVAAVEGLRDGMAQPLLDLLGHPADNDIVALEPSRHTVG